MTNQLTDKQIELVTKAILIYGKEINFVQHNNEGPSVYISGIIRGSQTIKYSKDKIELIVDDPDSRGYRTVQVCEVILKDLIEEGKHESDVFWSRSSEFISLK